jgi:hypothetical protein
VAFGLVLLPSGQVGAAPPAKQEARKFIIVGGNGGFQIVQGAEESPEEQALKLLKQARKLLTEKKPTGSAKRPDPKKVREAHRQVDALNRQLAKQRRALQRTEARLRQAQARLAQLEGKPAFRFRIPLQMQLKVRPDQGGKKPQATDKKGKPIALPQHLILRIQDGKIIGLTGKKAKPDPLQDLDARLDKILREVEELRREVERSTRPRK